MEEDDLGAQWVWQKNGNDDGFPRNDWAAFWSNMDEAISVLNGDKEPVNPVTEGSMMVSVSSSIMLLSLI